MTALVYLRSSFGFVFFRPKSVFFAFSWALLLFDIFAWNEPDRWREYRAVCIFGTGTVILYWLHLFTAISRELYRSGEDDHYSGASHGLRLAKFPGIGDAVSEKNLHLWGEPAAVLVLAALLSIVFGERHLSKWLVFVAACMVCKEGMNYWFSVRRDKIEEDMMGDVKGKGEGLPGDHPAPEAPKATRKEKVKRQRNTVSAEETAREKRYLEILRLREPYTLEKAEENFRTLIRLEHPDAGEDTPETNARSADLIEAIEFIREKLGA